MMLCFNNQIQFFLWSFLSTLAALMMLLNESTKSVALALQSSLPGHWWKCYQEPK